MCCAQTHLRGVSLPPSTSPCVHITSWTSSSGQAVHRGASVCREYLNLGENCTAGIIITLSVMLSP